jgi:hypothetical protein
MPWGLSNKELTEHIGLDAADEKKVTREMFSEQKFMEAKLQGR